jgi:hypothetical protein
MKTYTLVIGQDDADYNTEKFDSASQQSLQLIFNLLRVGCSITDSNHYEHSSSLIAISVTGDIEKIAECLSKNLGKTIEEVKEED